MAYIGPEPNPGQNREVDDISGSFNGSTTAFTLQVNSQNVSPGSANAIIVSVGGVVQNPNTDYTIASSTITFTTAPASGLTFFGLVLGQQVDTETTADGSVSGTKLTNPLDLADNHKIRFGTGNDLEIFHDNNGDSIIDNNNGDLFITTTGSADDIFIQSNDDLIIKVGNGQDGMKVIGDGAVELYFDDSKKIETASGGISLTGGAAANITSVTQSSGTITFDFAASCHHKVTLTQNATLAAPSNQAVGQSGSLFITQPNSGNYTVAYNSAFKFAGGSTPTASTSSDAVDRIDYIVLSSNHVHAVMSLDVKTGT